MAKQRYNTSIDSLSYAKSEVPYVAPPTKEILALLDSRENRYLKSKTNIDLAKDLAGSLPHNDISKDTYNDLVAGINGSIDGINKDHTDAAIITPAANPKSIFSNFGAIRFFKKNTIAEPSDVPRKGIANIMNLDIKAPFYVS